MDSECLIELPKSIQPVTAVRSTLVQSSLNTLRSRGHFDRYVEKLSPEHREAILGTLAPEWMPIEVGMAHYAACDALALTEQELLQIGEDVGNRIQGTFISTLVKKARTMGLTPWIPLGQFQRLWERLIQGGGVALYRRGPKDALVDVRQLPLARYAYFRAGFCGVIASAIKLGAGRSATVRVADLRNVTSRLMFTLAWV